jgi:hypothetical protein
VNTAQYLATVGIDSRVGRRVHALSALTSCSDISPCMGTAPAAWQSQVRDRSQTNPRSPCL